MGQLLQKFFGAAKMWFRQGLNLLSSDELACPKPTIGLGHIHSLDKEWKININKCNLSIRFIKNLNDMLQFDLGRV